jgi:hypothetical protein
MITGSNWSVSAPNIFRYCAVKTPTTAISFLLVLIMRLNLLYSILLPDLRQGLNEL